MTTPNTPMTEQERAGLAETLKYIAHVIERDGSYAPAGPEFVVRELRTASEYFAATPAPVLATEADCIEADLANLRYKQSGGVQVQLGPVAIEFATFGDWVNKAQRRFCELAATNRNAAQKRYLSIDAAGRVCMIGSDFMRARDENTFPVRVYLIDALEGGAA